VENSQQGIYFVRQTMASDKLFSLESSVQSEVIADILKFWTKKDIYAKMGYLWKRGVLLEGPPGSGKTCIINQLMEKVAEFGGISIIVDHPIIASRGLQLLRGIEPNRPIIGVLEELDELTESYNESEYMSLLDGELQVDNIVWIATTNYIEKLDNRVKNRPSRFDIVKHVGLPTRNDRARYLNHKIPDLKAEEIARWSMDTEGFSIAHLKELVLAVICLDADYEATIIRLKTMIKAADKEEGGGDTLPSEPQIGTGEAPSMAQTATYAPVTGHVAASIRAAGAAKGMMPS
jgi:AAA+ superfamily predicted ATPase